MKIKIDEDLPKAVAEIVREQIPDTITVVEERLSGTLDPDLWRIDEPPCSPDLPGSTLRFDKLKGIQCQCPLP